MTTVWHSFRPRPAPNRVVSIQRELARLRCYRRVAMFGGSFDPPHSGHVHVAGAALKQLRVQAVCWLVAPANPLKPPPHSTLEARTRQLQHNFKSRRQEKKHFASMLQGAMRTESTILFLEKLRPRLPRTTLIWLMGLDVLRELPRWQAWARLTLFPLAVAPRANATRTNATPNPAISTLPALRLSLFAHRTRKWQNPPQTTYTFTKGWTYMRAQLHHARSSAIRAHHAEQTA